MRLAVGLGIALAVATAGNAREALAVESSTVAAEAPPAGPQRLSFLLGVGWLGSLNQNGGLFAFGLRAPMGRWVAFGFDLGYGAIAAASGPTVQDRWWIMPSVALLIPVGPARPEGLAGQAKLEVGGGLGLGATSGYTDLPGYERAPFGPIWAYQLVPAVRAQVGATLPLSRCCDLFVRIDAATLILDGSTVGSRVGNPKPATTDTVWFNALVGAHFRLL